jgi:hypothetical protein
MFWPPARLTLDDKEELRRHVVELLARVAIELSHSLCLFPLMTLLETTGELQRGIGAVCL